MSAAVPKEAAPKEIEYEDGLRLVPRLLAKGRVETAAKWASKLCAHRPDDPRAHNQAGLAQQRHNGPDAAAAHFRRALVLHPKAAEIWANLGNAARRAGAAAEAVRQCRRAVCCRPDMPDIRLALGIGQLAAGDYAGGFAEYEHRPERTGILDKYAAAGVRPWDRRFSQGQRVLVVTEQGAGDAIQFLRFVRPLADRGVEITVACPPALERLVAAVDGVAATVPKSPSGLHAGFDGVELLMSLPACLGVDRGSLPAPARYLVPPPAPRTLPAGDRLRVGLCWTGSPAHPRDEPRRIPFAEIARALDLPGIDFYSLQVGPGRESLAGEARLTDLAPDIGDFADTAAMVDQMDLVISIDTSVAHLAGALGKPTWVLLAHVPDWRWGGEGEATPWYPRMRLFRQSRPGDWPGVMDRVVAELAEAVGQHARRLPVSG